MGKEDEEMTTVVDQIVEYENYITETIRPIKKMGNASSLLEELVGTEYKSGLTSYSELTVSNVLIFSFPSPFSLNCYFLLQTWGHINHLLLKISWKLLDG